MNQSLNQTMGDEKPSKRVETSTEKELFKFGQPPKQEKKEDWEDYTPCQETIDGIPFGISFQGIGLVFLGIFGIILLSDEASWNQMWRDITRFHVQAYVWRLFYWVSSYAVCSVGSMFFILYAEIWEFKKRYPTVKILVNGETTDMTEQQIRGRNRRLLGKFTKPVFVASLLWWAYLPIYVWKWYMISAYERIFLWMFNRV